MRECRTCKRLLPVESFWRQPGNVVIVSYRADRIKSDATAQELQRIARFYERLETNEIRTAPVPDVQPSEEEEARQVPQCVGVGR